MPHETFWKPAKGSGWLASKERSAERKAAERKVMDEAVRLDEHRCRVPRCPFMSRKPKIDPCHVQHRGMGGDPTGERTTVDSIIALCRPHHGQYDTGLLDFQPVDGQGGTRVAQHWYRRTSLDEPWEHFATESTIGVSVTRGA